MNTSSVKPKVIAVVGPTSSGKSSLAVEIATQHEGEVISVDSRQVYCGLDLSSGKITKEEMGGVPHHLLDIADPQETLTVAEFKVLAEYAIQGILTRGKLPILCGGTGFYMDAVLYDISMPEVPPNEQLRKVLETKSIPELLEELETKDPDRASTVDRHNKPRLIRALEIVDTLGRVPPQTSESPYDALIIGLRLDPDELKQRIHSRLLERVESGMIEEIKHVHDNGVPWERFEQLGLEFRYIARYLQGQLSKEEALLELEQEHYKYARRQMTWFKRNKDIKWFDPKDREGISEEIKGFLYRAHPHTKFRFGKVPENL